MNLITLLWSFLLRKPWLTTMPSARLSYRTADVGFVPRRNPTATFFEQRPRSGSVKSHTLWMIWARFWKPPQTIWKQIAGCWFGPKAAVDLRLLSRC
jgi:hypothetical protein